MKPDEPKKVDFTSPWPERMPFRIKLTEGSFRPSFDAENRELVRHHSYVPARAVALTSVAKPENLRRRHPLVSFTERTPQRAQFVLRLGHEVPRANTALRGKGHPPGRYWIPALLRQG